LSARAHDFDHDLEECQAAENDADRFVQKCFPKSTSALSERCRLISALHDQVERGIAVILTTMPPRHVLAAQAAAFAEAARAVAREFSVPLVDYDPEVLRRRTTDWDGATDDFRAFDGYDVPTLLSREGVHPSAPRRYQDDYSEQALRSHGYGLRNYLVLMKYAEVIDALAAPRQGGDSNRARN
jgi:hypothetical protein